MISLYKIFAPVLRKLNEGKILKKPIKGTSKSLFYEASQHLGFWWKTEIDYEPECRRIISPYIREGDLIFDIGANIGQYSLHFSEMIGHKGELICIEPDSDNYAFLNLNVTKNHCRNTITRNIAIGRQSGKLKFYKDTVTGGRMSTLIKANTAPTYRGLEEQVEVITLASLVDEYGIPSFIKIDVEGAEVDVLSSVDSRLSNTIFFVEVRASTKEGVFSIFEDQKRNVYLIRNGLEEVDSAASIPDFANLLIM